MLVLDESVTARTHLSGMRGIGGCVFVEARGGEEEGGLDRHQAADHPLVPALT